MTNAMILILTFLVSRFLMATFLVSLLMVFAFLNLIGLLDNVVLLNACNKTLTDTFFNRGIGIINLGKLFFLFYC